MQKQTAGIFLARTLFVDGLSINKLLTKKFTVSYIIYVLWIIFYVGIRTEQYGKTCSQSS